MMLPTDNDGGLADSGESTQARGLAAPLPRSTPALALFLAVALAASAVATIGWTRKSSSSQPVAPSIRIVDVRPLRAPDASLRNMITHTFAVRVAIRGWTLLPYQPGATAGENRPGAGHWRLYRDGWPLGDNVGAGHTTYVILPPGTHWLAAELSNADSTSLHPAVWSEPIIAHVPRHIRCWQTGWHGSPENGTPMFRCRS
jgi:hypothetical protein